MTKEELEKEARKYLAEHTKYSEIFGEFFVAVDTLTAMLDFAEPREKQIQIDAEQIRALQKQNGELTDKVKELEEELEQAKKGKVVEHFEAYGQCRDSRRIAELEAQIEKMKWHKVSDCDLPKDRHNVYVVYLNGNYQLEKTIASFRHKYWVINGLKTECEIIAWCELPKWEEKKK